MLMPAAGQGVRTEPKNGGETSFRRSNGVCRRQRLFRSGVCGEVFDIPTVDAGGGAVPSFIAAVLPAETDSEIAVLKSTETAGSPTLRLSAYTGMRAVLSCAYC